MNNANKTRILIVEDEPAIAHDIEDILSEEGYEVVGVAYNYNKAIAMLASKEVDLLMLDIALQGAGTGLDIASLVNEKFKVPFVFLTSFSDQETINQVVALNPAGYLVKPFKEKDIVTTVALAVANAKLLQKDPFPPQERLNKSLQKPLSTQEYRVLVEIWRGKKNIEIADELFVSINTVKTHVTKIYLKMDVTSRAQAINKAMAVLS